MNSSHRWFTSTRQTWLYGFSLLLITTHGHAEYANTPPTSTPLIAQKTPNISQMVGKPATASSPTPTKPSACQHTDNQGPEMVIIPAGSFKMGSNHPTITDEQPVHLVTIKQPFALSRCEITFADYLIFTAATSRENPKDNGWGKGDQPVINVNWHDATAYAEWLTKVTGRHYRLPSEAEWEYAARAKSETDYPWGEDAADKYAWFDINSNQQAQAVGTKAPNQFGLYDMIGNAYEWVQDCYEINYKKTPIDGSAWDPAICASGYRVLRGGSWSYKLEYLRSAYRFGSGPDYRYDIIGFRVAQDLP